MLGLDLTFQTLATTRNEAAIEVLFKALGDADASVRRRAIESLMCREESRCKSLLLEKWSLLTSDEIAAVRAGKKWLEPAVEQALREHDETSELAITAARQLELTSAIPWLVSASESEDPHRELATDALLSMVDPLGREARRDRDRPATRKPVVARLAEAVKHHADHGNTRLLDAFLAGSVWSDNELRRLLDRGSPHQETLKQRLLESQDPGVIELLSGFIRRRNIPESVLQVIRNRSDRPFRDALLEEVGTDPTGTTLQNLRRVGLPCCCRGGEALLDDMASTARASLAHLYVVVSQDPVSTLHLVCGVAERCDPGTQAAVITAFARCELPAESFWIQAAKQFVLRRSSETLVHDDARLLQRMIRLLDSHDPALAESAKKVLAPLHAGALMSKFVELRPRSRRRLGQVVLMIDPTAIERVRDKLRHPVLMQRLEAIAAADAFAAVDLLAETFEFIAMEDHQEARMRAAAVMKESTGDQTLAILREMVDLPESPVRDAAIEALRYREANCTEARHSSSTSLPVHHSGAASDVH